MVQTFSIEARGIVLQKIDGHQNFDSTLGCVKSSKRSIRIFQLYKCRVEKSLHASLSLRALVADKNAALAHLKSLRAWQDTTADNITLIAAEPCHYRP